MSNESAITEFASNARDGYEQAHSVGTTYGAAGAIELSCFQPGYHGTSLGTLFVNLESCTGLSATPKLTFRITSDELGDWCLAHNESSQELYEEATSDPLIGGERLIEGLDDSGNATAVCVINQLIHRNRRDQTKPDSSDFVSVYLWVKLDQGSASLDSAFIVVESKV